MDNGDIINGCTEFRYLGTIFTKDGRDTKQYTSQGNTSRIREVFGPLSRPPTLGKAKYNWEVAWYPRGCC